MANELVTTSLQLDDEPNERGLAIEDVIDWRTVFVCDAGVACDAAMTSPVTPNASCIANREGANAMP